MSIPIFNDGMLFAPSGNTFHPSGVVSHPLQKAGVIAHAGAPQSFKLTGTRSGHNFTQAFRKLMSGAGSEGQGYTLR